MLKRILEGLHGAVNLLAALILRDRDRFNGVFAILVGSNIQFVPCLSNTDRRIVKSRRHKYKLIKLTGFACYRVCAVKSVVYFRVFGRAG